MTWSAEISGLCCEKSTQHAHNTDVVNFYQVRHVSYIALFYSKLCGKFITNADLELKRKTLNIFFVLNLYSVLNSPCYWHELS